MKSYPIIVLAVVCMFACSFAQAYDNEMAGSYEKLFSSVSGAGAGKALHFVSPEKFVGDINSGKKVIVVDVRTTAETEIFGMTLAGSVAIPVDKVFASANLKKIPADKPVVIVCKSGARATAVGTSLRHIGFDNVYILKGGLQALSAYCGPKQAYAPPAEK